MQTAPKEPPVPRPKKAETPVPKPKKAEHGFPKPKKAETPVPKPKKDEIKRITVTGIIDWLWKAFIWLAGWFLGIVFIVYALGSLRYGPLSIFLFPLSLLLIPTVRKIIKKKFKIEFSTGLVIVILFITCVLVALIDDTIPDPCDECGWDEECIDGVCYLVEDPCASCPPDEKCINGVCYNLDELCAKCYPGEKCIDGECISEHYCGNGICDTDENCFNCQDCLCGPDEQCDNGVCVPIDEPVIRTVTLFYDDFSEGFPNTRWTYFEQTPDKYDPVYEPTVGNPAPSMSMLTYDWVINTPEPGVDHPSQQQPWIKVENLVRTAVSPFNSQDGLALTASVVIPPVAESGKLIIRVRDQADESKAAYVRIVPSSGKIYYIIEGQQTVTSDSPVPRDGEFHTFTFWLNTEGWAWWMLDDVEQLSSTDFFHGKYILEFEGTPKRDWIQAAGVNTRQHYYIDNVQVVSFEPVS